MKHALTIDVEDDFNIGMYDLFGIQLPPSDRVVSNSERLLDLLQETGVRATFFVLGEVARSYPTLIKRMSRDGHEVGVHGFYHIQFFRMDRETAHEALKSAKQTIEDISGRAVLGHRAPAFSIRQDTAWALETLVELGFQYDSSIVPCKGRRYGWPGIPKHIHTMRLPGGAMITEAPLPTVAFLGMEMPVCGGGYLRHFPFIISQWAMRRLESKRPVIVYLHPYDIDLTPLPSDFQMHLEKAGSKVKRYMALQVRNRNTMEGKLRRLISNAEFIPLVDVIEQNLSQCSDHSLEKLTTETAAA